MHLEARYVWETVAFQVIPNHFFEKVIRLQRAQEGDSGSISFAAFRLYEPKSREGVLGPDLRVLILLEYPGVSPRGLPDEGPMVKVGAGREACRGRVITEAALWLSWSLVDFSNFNLKV